MSTDELSSAISPREGPFSPLPVARGTVLLDHGLSPPGPHDLSEAPGAVLGEVTR